jgi:hypothetical protein
MTTKTTPENEVAKRCIVAAIERDLGDDNGFIRDLLEDAAAEIDRLSNVIKKVQEDWETAWAKRNDLAAALNALSRNYTDDKTKLKPEAVKP